MNDCTRPPQVSFWMRPELFRALGDETRLAVLARIAGADRPLTVSEIQDCCGIHLSGVSRHLSHLRRVGLVECEKQGREVRYRLALGEAITCLKGLAASLENCCRPREEGDDSCCTTKK